MAKSTRTQDARKPGKKPVRASESTTYLDELQQALQLQHSGQFGQAIEILQRVLRLDPNHVEANYALGMLFHSAGQIAQAVPLLQKTVALRPKLFEAALNCGIVLRAAGLFDEAQANLERAIALKPTSSRAHVTLGLLLIDRNDIGGAERMFLRAAALQPRNADAHAQLGFVHKTRGELGPAAACYRKAVALNPLYGEAHRGLAYLQKYREYDRDVELMEKIFNAKTTPDPERMVLGFALGKVFDDLQQFDKAFGYLAEGNRLKRQTFSFSLERRAELFDWHKRAFGRETIEQLQRNATPDTTPIFVLGMPRSGTSLVEQILASHPDVHGAGEIDYLRIVTDTVERLTGRPFPMALEQVQPSALHDATASYLAKLKALAPAAARITDKLPHNFLRIGLIRGLMPNAKIVHCDRDPIDNCLSIFQHHFSSAHDYASNLEELGSYYRLYEDLMKHWHGLLPQQIYRLEYERLTADPEAEVRRLLDHCGLPFHSDCLHFHETDRVVNTPSAQQVREPMYRSSVARWKNYENHLQPLLQALAGTQS